VRKNRKRTRGNQLGVAEALCVWRVGDSGNRNVGGRDFSRECSSSWRGISCREENRGSSIGEEGMYLLHRGGSAEGWDNRGKLIVRDKSSQTQTLLHGVPGGQRSGRCWEKGQCTFRPVSAHKGLPEGRCLRQEEKGAGGSRLNGTRGLPLPKRVPYGWQKQNHNPPHHPTTTRLLHHFTLSALIISRKDRRLLQEQLSSWGEGNPTKRILRGRAVPVLKVMACVTQSLRERGGLAPLASI